MPSLRVSYQTLEFSCADIHLRTLRDLQQFSDDTGEAERLGIPLPSWPLFGVIWDSGQVLAHLMSSYDIAGKRILEVGCGIALASLVLNSRGADVTATDYHPEVANFLAENVRLNGGREIPFVRTGWQDQDTDLGRFDLIIGSDLIYELADLGMLAAFIDRHAAPSCEVLMVDPGRRWQTHFSEKMEQLGYSSSSSVPENTEYLLNPFEGKILRYKR
ncbi:methyltransferase domain-containing protein [Solimonas sp. K1W22B-7]|uniref:class I SAM-dependent methyltransferase n=1 Tax=Solimonas sp. K1W22B-7 TaxID=2303331 RepID=UPI000E32F3F2|nr:methyltransferase domain-containing protein [Solimonas sp. K1W22B-7]AXQ27784.1 methyltransferase domain-containing protein [Solimonas sp. K1W22B-7]